MKAYNKLNYYKINQNKILFMVENNKYMLVDLLVKKELNQILMLSDADFSQIMNAESITKSGDKTMDIENLLKVRSSSWHDLLTNNEKSKKVLIPIIEFLNKENTSKDFILYEVKH